MLYQFFFFIVWIGKEIERFLLKKQKQKQMATLLKFAILSMLATNGWLVIDSLKVPKVKQKCSSVFVTCVSTGPY